MHLGDPADSDLVTLPSAHGAAETVGRLKALLAQKGIEVFAHIDHAEAARKVGLPLRPTQVLIFGNPKAGTPLMKARADRRPGPGAAGARLGRRRGKGVAFLQQPRVLE